MSKKKELNPKELGKLFGSLGGNATSKKYGKEHFKKLAEIRWSKNKDAFSPKTRTNQ